MGLTTEGKFTTYGGIKAYFRRITISDYVAAEFHSGRT